MISKFNGICCYCKKPTLANRDEYEIETKRAYHIECHENRPPTPEDYALADRLGYRQFSWESLLSLPRGVVDERERPDRETR